MLLHLVACPEPACGAVAEIADHIRAGSTGASVAHFKTRCLRRHVFIVPADQVVHIDLPEYGQPEYGQPEYGAARPGYGAARPGYGAAGPPGQA